MSKKLSGYQNLKRRHERGKEAEKSSKAFRTFLEVGSNAKRPKMDTEDDSHGQADSMTSPPEGIQPDSESAVIVPSVSTESGSLINEIQKKQKRAPCLRQILMSLLRGLQLQTRSDVR